MDRRSFILGGLAMTAGGVARPAAAMRPDEQKAWDDYRAATVAPMRGLLDGEPALMAPDMGSMGVVIAVNALSEGYVEVADNPGLKNARRFVSEGFPQPEIDDRVLRVRLTDLRPGGRYWYRAGAARLERVASYWNKPSEIVWGNVHSFVVPGETAPSHFAMMTDTHAQYAQMARITRKYRAAGVPLVVWNGDIPRGMTYTREELVKNYLSIPDNLGYAADTPIALNRGNHDYRGIAALRMREVAMPRNPSGRGVGFERLEYNFAIRMGEIALIGLDTGEDKPDNHPANHGVTSFTAFRRLQADWLRAQLKRPEIAAAPYVVAFVHIPLFDPRPDANPGTLLEDYAQWQGECAQLWSPILSANRVQLVLAGHQHRYRYDPPSSERPWAQIVGGGRGEKTFQTLVEGFVEKSRLVVCVYNTDEDSLVATHEFSPR